jgi:hypothetical protein
MKRSLLVTGNSPVLEGELTLGSLKVFETITNNKKGGRTLNLIKCAN